uniref:Uncharacterized protein n=1 Tax=Solanum tuberosum TaxID=4113 RepID=M1BA20_SOLTU
MSLVTGYTEIVDLIGSSVPLVKSQVIAVTHLSLHGVSIGVVAVQLLVKILS